MNKFEKQVLDIIGEDPDSPDVFTDDEEGIAQIRESISEAVQEISMVSGGYKETFHLPLVADKAFYRIEWAGGHFGWVTDAWLVNEQRRLEMTDLTRLQAINPRWMIYSSSPDSYFQVGLDVVGFSPKPSSTSDIVELNCVVVPDIYKTDADRIKLRHQFEWAVVSYAVSEFFASRGDAKQASRWYVDYLNVVGDRNTWTAARGRIGQIMTHKEPWPTESNPGVV